jgi:hypothetical protein
MKLDGKRLPRELLDVSLQPEVGEEAYNIGAKMLVDFFKDELQKFNTPDLDPLGRQIIDAFMDGASVEDYNKLIPCGSLW